MPNDFFKFKQFTVYHDLCAMKVGTDGVLLGAWVDCMDCNHILDVGSGSGLIALMMAQRSQARIIEAIDIDEGAYKQTLINVERSPFASRIHAGHEDYRSFNPGYLYDLIVSNPPYFSMSLENPDVRKAKARHNTSLPFEHLILKSSLLLKDGGRLAVIIPFEVQEQWNKLASSCQLYLSKETIVKPKPDSPPKRILMEYTKGSVNRIYTTELIIEYERHLYSKEYIALTKDFYLKREESSGFRAGL